jgi:type IV pilus assembly protein PilW
MRQAGLTLVELMVALTLGLFLTLGLVLMMSDTSRSFKIQDDYARMQENAVSGLRYISESLRHAGFYGLAAQTIPLQPYGTVGSITDACGATVPYDSLVPLFGYDSASAATAAAVVPCINAANFVAPGSILIARLASGLAIPDAEVPSDGNLANAIVDAGTIYVQSDIGSGWVFKGSEVTAYMNSEGKRHANNRHYPAFPYQMHVYYVRPCSRPTGSGGLCLATDDGGRPIPTLVRQELVGSTMQERPLAEGVERITFLYGIDVAGGVTGDGDGIADRYVRAPTIAQWDRVVAVRVTLLVRTPTLIAGQDDSGKDYDLDGDGTPDYTCTASADPNACAYKRAVFSQVIQVRNIAFRRGA